MNQFYYENRAKEKVRELMQEGQRSQAFHRSRARNPGLFSRLQGLMLRILGRGSTAERPAAQVSEAKAILTEYGD
jgi:hypothetical protein